MGDLEASLGMNFCFVSLPAPPVSPSAGRGDAPSAQSLLQNSASDRAESPWPCCWPGARTALAPTARHSSAAVGFLPCTRG